MGHSMKKRNAFTLVELLAVMFIITLLMGLVMSAMRYSTDRAARTQAEAAVQQIRNAVVDYQAANGALPEATNSAGKTMVAAFRAAPTGTEEQMLEVSRQLGVPLRPYLDTKLHAPTNAIVLDPRNRTYMYHKVGQTFLVWSFGNQPTTAFDSPYGDKIDYENIIGDRPSKDLIKQ